MEKQKWLPLRQPFFVLFFLFYLVTGLNNNLNW